MKIYAYDYDYESNNACTIIIPSQLKDVYIQVFGVASPSKKQVEKWLDTKGYILTCPDKSRPCDYNAVAKSFA